MSKNVIIFGSSRGIGKACVEYFLDKGHSVLALSRNIEPLKEIASKNKALSIVQFDLESASIATELAEVIKDYSSFDIVINNAGLLVNKPFIELTKEDMQRSYQVNVIGVMECLQVLYPKLKGNDGHVLNISSMGGFQGSAKFPGLSTYSTSKAAVASLAELLAEEWKEDGIKVNALCLGAVQTEMLASAFPGYEAPMNADEMAEYICTFAINEHRWINGKVIPVSISTP